MGDIPAATFRARPFFVQLLLGLWLVCLAQAAEPLVSITVTPEGPVIISGQSEQFAAAGTFRDGSTRTLISTTERIYTANGGTDSVSIIDPNNNTVVATVPVTDNPRGVAVRPAAERAYVTNNPTSSLGSVSVIDTISNAVVATVPVGLNPAGVAVDETTERVYVANFNSSSITVIDATDNSVVADIPVAPKPFAVAVNAGANRAYVAHFQGSASDNVVSVIDTVTNAVVATVSVGFGARGLAVNEVSNRVYVTNNSSHTVSVIDTINDAVIATIDVASSGLCPDGVAVDAATNKAYVANACSGTVSVIDTATNSVAATLNFGISPRGVALHPVGERLYVTDFNGSKVGVIDIASNVVLASVTVLPNPDGVAMKVGEVTWTSSDESVATVEQNGLALAVGAGTTIITATSDGVTASTLLTVLASVTISRIDRTASEAGLTTGVFRVTRTGSTAAPATVMYSVAGTATPGIDYTALPGSVVIPAGLSSVDILVMPIDDLLLEGSETVIVTLVPDPAYTLGSRRSATIRIVSDERVSISTIDRTATEAELTTGAFRVTRTGSTVAPATVMYSVAGTATPGIDYTALPGSVVIPAGLSSVDILLMPIDDLLVEGSETVIVTLVPDPAYTLGSRRSATIRIVSDERVSISTIDRTATEAGPTAGAFRVTRTGSTAASVTVTYAVTGTATPGIDYTALPGSVIIPAGLSSVDILVTPIDDLFLEGSETVIVTLVPDPAYTLGSPRSARITIVSDEKVSISATTRTATEAGPTAGAFRVTRTGSTAASVTVTYAVTGTATPGLDYTALPGSVLIPAGLSSVDILVTPVDDLLLEGTETVILTLARDPAYALGSPRRAAVTIVSDE